MNKILFIIFFTTTFCFSQNEKKTLEYLENIFCNRPFSTHGKISGDDFKLNIKSNKNKFYLEYIKGDYKQKVICNEKIILKFDYNHEELEIYSLTQKEKRKGKPSPPQRLPLAHARLRPRALAWL